VRDAFDMLESKDGALLPRSSRFPPSAPHTGQVAFTTSGAPIPAGFLHFRTLPVFGYGSILLPLQHNGVPGISRPLPPILWSPEALDGRNSVGYFGSAIAARALVTYPPIPMGSSLRFPAFTRTVCSPSALGVLPFPYDLRAGPGSPSNRISSSIGSSLLTLA
jgi:hypothetical protein